MQLSGCCARLACCFTSPSAEDREASEPLLAGAKDAVSTEEGRDPVSQVEEVAFAGAPVGEPDPAHQQVEEVAFAGTPESDRDQARRDQARKVEKVAFASAPEGERDQAPARRDALATPPPASMHKTVDTADTPLIRLFSAETELFCLAQKKSGQDATSGQMLRERKVREFLSKDGATGYKWLIMKKLPSQLLACPRAPRFDTGKEVLDFIKKNKHSQEASLFPQALFNKPQDTHWEFTYPDPNVVNPEQFAATETPTPVCFKALSCMLFEGWQVDSSNRERYPAFPTKVHFSPLGSADQRDYGLIFQPSLTSKILFLSDRQLMQKTGEKPKQDAALSVQMNYGRLVKAIPEIRKTADPDAIYYQRHVFWLRWPEIPASSAEGLETTAFVHFTRRFGIVLRGHFAQEGAYAVRKTTSV